jgi:hypothetical protein
MMLCDTGESEVVGVRIASLASIKLGMNANLLLERTWGVR